MYALEIIWPTNSNAVVISAYAFLFVKDPRSWLDPQSLLSLRFPKRGGIESNDDAATVFGKAVEVRVRFGDGAELPTAAYILRHDAGELVLKFTRPVESNR